MSDMAINGVSSQSVAVAGESKQTELGVGKSFADMYNEEIVKASAPNINPAAYISQFGEMPKYIVTPGIVSTTNYTENNEQTENLSQTINNDTDSEATATSTPEAEEENVASQKYRQTTDEDLSASGYNVDVLKANALNVNPMAYVSQFGEIPKYVVPYDLVHSTDYTTTVGTAQDIARTISYNAALGFTTEIKGTK